MTKISSTPNFDIFVEYTKPKLKAKYPFLTNSQILNRLKDQWKNLKCRQQYCKQKVIKPSNKAQVVRVSFNDAFSAFNFSDSEETHSKSEDSISTCKTMRIFTQKTSYKNVEMSKETKEIEYKSTELLSRPPVSDGHRLNVRNTPKKMYKKTTHTISEYSKVTFHKDPVSALRQVSSKSKRNDCQSKHRDSKITQKAMLQKTPQHISNIIDDAPIGLNTSIKKSKRISNENYVNKYVPKTCEKTFSKLSLNKDPVYKKVFIHSQNAIEYPVGNMKYNEHSVHSFPRCSREKNLNKVIKKDYQSNIKNVRITPKLMPQKECIQESSSENDSQICVQRSKKSKRISTDNCDEYVSKRCKTVSCTMSKYSEVSLKNVPIEKKLSIHSQSGIESPIKKQKGLKTEKHKKVNQRESYQNRNKNVRITPNLMPKKIACEETFSEIVEYPPRRKSKRISTGNCIERCMPMRMCKKTTSTMFRYSDSHNEMETPVKSMKSNEHSLQSDRKGEKCKKVNKREELRSRNKNIRITPKLMNQKLHVEESVSNIVENPQICMGTTSRVSKRISTDHYVDRHVPMMMCKKTDENDTRFKKREDYQNKNIRITPKMKPQKVLSQKTVSNTGRISPICMGTPSRKSGRISSDNYFNKYVSSSQQSLENSSNFPMLPPPDVPRRLDTTRCNAEKVLDGLFEDSVVKSGSELQRLDALFEDAPRSSFNSCSRTFRSIVNKNSSAVDMFENEQDIFL